MAIPIAIERGWITRKQGFERLAIVVDFLHTKADRFHGAFPHWLNGTSGEVQPFSAKDDGADLVETAYMIQGLLTAQQYFKNGNQEEKNICNTIQEIWEEVEWTWFQQNGQQKLYWHWSPNYEWEMNMPITGWNECLIVYVLAASSSHLPDRKISLRYRLGTERTLSGTENRFTISCSRWEKTEAAPCFLHITHFWDLILETSQTLTQITGHKTEHMRRLIIVIA